jgi:hypothetical protein
MRKLSGILLLMAAVILVGACSDDSGSSSPLTVAFDTPQDGDGDVQYYTNDPAQYGEQLFEPFSAEDPPVYKMKVKKISGSRTAGYGMAFCIEGYRNDITGFYRVLITVDGTYQVMKAYKNNNGWTEVYFIPDTEDGAQPKAEHLITGHKTENTIEIKRPDPQDSTTFEVYFNGQYENRFIDPDPLTGTDIAYWTNIGQENEEKFPDEPVDVRFYRP